ncbi:MAG TPA: PIG-L family deacetylase [Gaiellaceae bacterium]|nr:PIG-L family deacetylase [Gaiellaceae bacterium]
MSREPVTARGRRLAIVSPHLDDGILSLGAAIAAWARVGARVLLVTVFALEPASEAPSGGWDRRAGFATEGEAARARREEDRRACAIVGAEPVWLPFGSVDYERRGNERTVREAVAAALAGADAVLLPGYPLTQPDHAWLARALLGHDLGPGRVGLYAEQPYAARAGGPAAVPSWLGVEGSFEPARAGLRDLLAKWRAVRAYRSQLPLLGMRELRRGPLALALKRERVAWLDGRGRSPV